MALAATLAGAATPGLAFADDRAARKAPAGPDRPELRAALQAWIDAGFAGMTMRVRDQRGEWAGSAGVRKLGEPARPPLNGHGWVGSVTKPFTATVVLQLAAEGRVGLDAPVAGYLPELGLNPRITVRMLLRHTSGLFNYTGDAYDGRYEPGIPGTGKEWVDNRFHTYQPEELVRLALSKPPVFAPDADQRYANTNFTLALLLIEKITGRSYAEEVRRRIVRPLGLRGTVVPGARTRLPGPHSHGYYRYQDAGEWKVVDVTRQNLSLLAGAGDLISTTKDLQAFISALLGGRLLPAPLLAEMREPYGPYGLGLGLWVQDLGPGRGTIVHHNGGAPGGYGALMISTPDGSKTLTALLTTGDAEMDPAVEYPKALGNLIDVVFGGE